MRRRRHRGTSSDDDRAVSEVIGFIMMFALSALILVFTMEAFDVTNTRTKRASAGVQLQAFADQVSSRVVQAGLVANQYENTTFAVEITMPPSIEGNSYVVTGTNRTIYVNSTNEQVETNSTTFETEAIDDVWVHGTVYSGPYDLEVKYQHKPERSSVTKDISLDTGQGG